MSNQFLKLRRSSVPGRVPTTSSLDFGEIALNTYDGLAFIKKSGSNGEQIITIGSTSGSFTGSFFGTSSWSVNAVTASYVTASNVYGPFGSNSVISSSYTLTASYALNAGTSTAVTNQITTGSVTASVNIGTASFQLVSGSSTFLFVGNSGNISIGQGIDSGWRALITGSGVSGSLNLNNILTVSSSNVIITGSLNVSNSTSSYVANIQNTRDVGSTEHGLRISLQNGGGNANFIQGWLTQTGGLERFRIRADGAIFTTSSITVAAGGGLTNTIVGPGTAGTINNVNAIYWNNDGDGYIGSPADGTFVVATNAIERIRITPGVIQMTGSVIAPNITGSLFGTASWALNALTASSADNFTLRGDITGSNALFTGTITAQTLVVQTVTSSVAFITGSTKFGSQSTNTHQFTGSVSISGSLSVVGPLNATSSWATNSLTASLAATSSWALNALTASYVPSTAIIGDLSRIATASFTASVNSSSFQITSASSNIFNIDNAGQISVGGIGTGPSSVRVYSGNANSITVNRSVAGYSELATFYDASGTNAYLNINAQAQYRIGGDTILARDSANVFAQRSGIVSQSFRIYNTYTDAFNFERGKLEWTGSVFNIGTEQSGSGTARNLALQTSGSTRLFISSSGLVGIGTSAPSFSLDVSGSGRFSDQLYIESASIDYQQNLSVATGSWQTIVASPTASYKAAFFDYVAFSGSIGRAGIVTTFWSASATEFYENFTEDLGGNTSGVVLQTAISASQIVLQATASSAAWTIRSLVRLL